MAASGRLRSHRDWLRGDHEHCNPMLADDLDQIEEALHNLIVLARPYMRDEAQEIGMAQARLALHRLRGTG